jgi:hypothetical protein
MNSYFNFIDTAALDKKIQSGEFPFSQNLFWDTAVENIDLKKNQRYVIERVLTRGFLQDFYILLQLYTTKELKEAIIKSKELDAKTINFCSNYFNIPKPEMHASSFYH